eukprot:753655-Hanusia_phi.AAC.1
MENAVLIILGRADGTSLSLESASPLPPPPPPPPPPHRQQLPLRSCPAAWTPAPLLGAQSPSPSVALTGVGDDRPSSMRLHPAAAL